MTIAVSAVFGVVFALASLGVLYGRFRKVTVPKPRYWICWVAVSFRYFGVRT